MADTLDFVEDYETNKRIDLVLLPPTDIPAGDSDTENIKENNIVDSNECREVAGCLKVQTSESVTGTVASSEIEEDLTLTGPLAKKRNNLVLKKIKSKKDPKIKREYITAIKKTRSEIGQAFHDDELSSEDKVQLTLSKSDIFKQHNYWNISKDPVVMLNALERHQTMPDSQRLTWENLQSKLIDKSPVELFELIITESERYAHQHNASDYTLPAQCTLPVYDLKKFVGVLLLSGYHSLPQQHLYWERTADVETPIIYNSISKNRFLEIKRYLHFTNNDDVGLTDKYYKVRPLYNILNKAFKQFGFFDLNYSIDEMIVPYNGRQSSKQTMREK